MTGPRFRDHESGQDWCETCLRDVVLAERCFWCKTAEPALRDLDNGNGWCVGCASDTIFKGDPIDYYEELTPAGAEYTRLLARRSFRRRVGPAD